MYHGGDFQGVIDHLPYLKELGVTALWLTPVYDNTNTTYPSPLVKGERVSDYHGYGTIDYYGVDEHFGTLATLRKLVDAARAQGIKVIQDQVANHVSPVHPWVRDAPTPNWFHGTASRHPVETFHLWNLIDPHAPEELTRPVFDGWFADLLPDTNQEDPEVATYEIQNALWWIGMAGFDAIRQDTLPYVPRPFWAKWSTALKRQYPRLNIVGEVLDSNPAITSFFQTGAKRLGHDAPEPIDSGIDSVFDYPLYFSIRETLARGKKLEDLIKTIANDGLYPHPETLVTIFGDHDVPRFLEEPGANEQRLKLAFAFLLTARGIPTIYYGDEIGMRGGDDPDNRRDFPGGWPGDRPDSFRDRPELFHYVKTLTAARARSAALRRGNMINLAESAQAWAYARKAGSDMAIVALNNGVEAETLTLRLAGESRMFISATAQHEPLIFHDGSAHVTVPPSTALVFTASDK